jgi:hypothetical protein
MNIFYLHEDPSVAASYMYDKHVVKMILESAQMLCTAHHHYGNGDNVPYKKAHYNHPSTKWVRENSLHYDWLYEHMMSLGTLYRWKYGREHMTISKCEDSLFNVHLSNRLNVCPMSTRQMIQSMRIGITTSVRNTA